MVYANPTNISGMFGLATYANTVTNGYFWEMILIALFCTLFFAMKNYPAGKAFATASFLVWVIAVMLIWIGLISLTAFILCSIVAGIGLVGLFIQNKGG